MAKDRESRALSKAAGKRAGQSLSEEERALWELAARDLKPIKGKKQRVHASHDEAEERAPRRAPEAKKADAARAPQRAVAAPAKAAASAPPAPTGLDRRTARQIGSGRIDIEARIDLHGMRQSEAHTELIRFLMQAYAGGKRLVLVITGKGGPVRGAGHTRDHDDLGTAGERGVLKRNVPRWLAEPGLSAIVVGYTAAGARHGGEGALYVRLRKRDRPASG